MKAFQNLSTMIRFLLLMFLSTFLVESFVVQPSSSSFVTGQTRLFSSSDRPSSSSSSEISSSNIRFLGRGKNAIVRPGVVLVAPAEEFHHFLRQAAVFIYAMGTNDDDEYVIRGVILDHPTPFTMGEMMESKTSGGVFDNLIYRGGDTGPESAFCLHSVDSMGLEEIGTSGIHQGGDLTQIPDPTKVKFFFNYMEFLEQELEDMLDVTHSDGDSWAAVEVPPEFILDSGYDRGDAWSRLRNAIREQP
eukprot:CAMPEP_0178835740 /NCGR_PEP_ID=MMETSP0746-20121128/11793_1 /TAXON_ID=913974 /ORGANISM="Nitzschia punctata, Strain CCMP561" /LENGTH=246 /DNA_ID=CAMNT_0020498345 /DNA_START=176 /DNA_END=916 /DNA_ORIENTATION=-